jgi:hypothetical protein
MTGFTHDIEFKNGNVSLNSDKKDRAERAFQE